MRHKTVNILLTVLLIGSLFVGCSQNNTEAAISGHTETTQTEVAISEYTETVQSETISAEPAEIEATIAETAETDESTLAETGAVDDTIETYGDETIDPPAAEPTVNAPAFDLSLVPEFSGDPYTAVNGNIPYFTNEEITAHSFEQYSPLDLYGRCGVTGASIGRDLMPTEERGSIGMVKPTGWHTVKYDCVDGKYLYNRCHLIGYQLSGENGNTRNLITGTRYLNIEGMLPFENMVADYVKETGNHVMYRVTPIFQGTDLLASGVLMEGWSVEDNGEGICYCVFAYNVQPGVILDYTNGDSSLEYAAETTQALTEESTAGAESAEELAGSDYVLNKNTKKFHYPDCSSVDRMKESNKEYYTGSRDDLIARGYDPCKNCRP